MEFTCAVIYIALAIVFIIIDLYFAAKSYLQGTIAGTYLGRAAVLGALVTAAYLLSILLTDYFAASLMCSLYFMGIDWMLLILLQFTTILSIRIPLEKDIPLMWVLRFLAVADNIVLLINPFREIAVRYVPVESIIAHFKYEKLLLYDLHLVYTYLLVLGVLGILVRRTLRTPPRYRNQFIFITISILVIVIVNAFFIIPEDDSLYSTLDCSVLGYSVVLMFMYWSSFRYNETIMLEGLSKVIFDNVNQGLILFDWMNFLVMHNRRLEEIMPQFEPSRNLTMDEFLAQCGIPGETLADKKNDSIQSFSRKGDMVEPVRCDYRKLQDKGGNIIGQLFVFSDDSAEMDLLTGFQSWDHFRRSIKDHRRFIDGPYAAVMFDINGLRQINRRLGTDVGNRRLRSLAEVIRQTMPEGSRLVRGYDAHLIAICPDLQETEMRTYAQQVTEDYDGSVEFGIAAPEDEYESVLKVLTRASRAMLNRKLLDEGADRSQLIASLVRALKESDSDTEDHVQRTENMGRALGERLQLTDLQLSQLSLLCLLHDIGKVGVPLEILNKPGKLNDEEWAVMQTHVEKGYQIAVSSRELQDIAEMVRAHHERWDGGGYPHHLKQEEIPILSRIISVVDSYDAMVNDRAYRSAMSEEMARAEIRRCSGSQFDPDVARQFLQMLEEMDRKADRSGKSPAGQDPAKAGPAPREPEPGARDVKDEDAAKAGPAFAAGAEGTLEREKSAAGLLMAEAEDKHIRSHAVFYSRYLLDDQNQLLDADDHFEELTGYTKRDIHKDGLNQADLIVEEDRVDYFMNVDQQMAQGDIIYIEHDIRRKDGGIVHVYCCGRRYFDAASKTIRADIIIVDADTTQHGKGKTQINLI